MKYTQINGSQDENGMKMRDSARENERAPAQYAGNKLLLITEVSQANNAFHIAN